MRGKAMGWVEIICFHNDSSLIAKGAYIWELAATFMDTLSDTYLEFKEAGDFILIEPLSLTYPSADSDWDKSWIKTKVTLKAGVFNGQFFADFRTFDFEFFKRQMKTLYNDFTATVNFQPLEQQLILDITGDGLGHFEIRCEATPEPHLGQTLSFAINFDQTEIKNYIRQLDHITRLFPVKGDLKIQND